MSAPSPLLLSSLFDGSRNPVVVYACKGRWPLLRIRAEGAVRDRDVVTNADANVDRTNAATGANWRTANDARKRRTILSAVQTRRWRRLNVGEEEGIGVHVFGKRGVCVMRHRLPIPTCSRYNSSSAPARGGAGGGRRARGP